MFPKTASLLLVCAISASAATIVVDTTDRGYYYSSDFSDTTNKNYLTGQLNFGAGTDYYHSFFAFGGLSGLTGPIVSATLTLFNPAGGYSSTQASELLRIDGFSGNVATLNAGGTVSGEYSALAAGATYGTQSVSAADDGSFINIPLDAAGIAFLNANGGSPFAFGGYLAGIPGADTSSRYVFGGSAFVLADDGNTTLTIVTESVPEPGTLSLVLLGLLVFLVSAKRRRPSSARDLLVALSLLAFAIATPIHAQTPKTGVEPSRTVSFVPNRGQAPTGVLWQAEAQGFEAFFRKDGFVLRVSVVEPAGKAASQQLTAPVPPKPAPTSVRVIEQGVTLVGIDKGSTTEGSTNEGSTLEALDPQPGKISFFRGNDPARWVRGLPTYARLRYKNVYPGIDLLFYGNHGTLEYDFVVSPGADPSAIRLRLDRGTPSQITARGELRVGEGSEAVLHRPLLYQNLDNGKRMIEGTFVRRDQTTVAFRFSNYDSNKTLIIDPALSLLYSTYLGGYHDDEATGIALDGQGNAYIVGFSESPNYPISGNAYQQERANLTQFITNIVVTKINASGILLFSTFLGGSTGDTSGGIVLDSKGNAYITGFTKSSDFPVTANAYQTIFPNGAASSAFFSELSPDGSALLYSSFFGGAGGAGPLSAAAGFAIARNPQGNVVISGNAGPGLPTTSNAYLKQISTGTAAYVAVFNLSLSGAAQLVASTYYGTSTPAANNSGTGNLALAMALDSSGNPWIAGQSYTNNLPTTGNAYQGSIPALNPNCGGGPLNSVAYFAKLSANLTTLDYASYLSGKTAGSTCSEYAHAILLDGPGNVYVAGTTSSSAFPTTGGVFQSTDPSNGYAEFVTKVSPDGTHPLWSTYLGGSGFSFQDSLALDSQNNVWVSGTTQGGSNFPLVNAYQATEGGGYDGHVTQIKSDGTAVLYSTYLGGSGNDVAAALAVDAQGNVYVAGYTTSTNFPVTSNAFEPQKAYGGPDYNGNDIFFTVLGAGSIGALSSTSAGNTGDTTLTITGAGLQQGSACSLVQGSTTIKAATAVLASDGSSITCTFALNGAATGSYNVAVNSPNGTSLMEQNAFTVQSGGQSQVWADIVGRSLIRTGVPATFFITYGNSGTTTAYFTTVWLAIPSYFQYTLPGGVQNLTDATVSVSDQSASMIDATDASIKIPFIIPVLPAGATGTIAVQLTDPTNNDSFTLAAYTQPPWFGSFQDAANALIALNQTTAPASPACTAPAGQPELLNCLGYWADLTANPLVRTITQIFADNSPDSSGNTYSVNPTQVKLAIERTVALDFMDALSIQTEGTTVSSISSSSAQNRGTLLTAAPRPRMPGGGLLPNPLFGDPGSFPPNVTSPSGTPIPEPPITVPPAAPVAAEAIPGAEGAIARAIAFNPELLVPAAVMAIESGIIYDETQTLLKLTKGDLCAGLGLGLTTGPPTVDLSPCDDGYQILTVTFHCSGGDYKQISPVMCTPPNPCKNGTGKNCDKGKGGGSRDPNEKTGSGGDGSANHYVSGNTPLKFYVGFENEASATLPAAQVVITDQLNPTKVDLSTLSLGVMAFGSSIVTVPGSTNNFNTTFNINSSLSVRIQGALDPSTGLLKWTFTSIDPSTGLPPSDPTLGFLPPDTDGIKGQGSVTFTVMPKSGLTTGTQITNQATVVFDANAPINTATWLNTIDVNAPQSAVHALPATEAHSTFTVSWSGTDVGSGIATYNIYVSDNGGPHTLWQNSVAGTSAAFSGAPGHTYAFYSIATDGAGNVEPSKSAVDTSTTLSGTAAAAQLSISKSHLGSFTRGQTTAQYMLIVSNAASAGATSGTVTVTENPPAGLVTVTAMSGYGWTCNATSCTRSEPLFPGQSYPSITVTATVAAAVPSLVTNTASVSGGGSATANASDPTTISSPGIVNVDFSGSGRSGALLYDPTSGQSYTALSNGDGTYRYVPNLFTSAFDTLRIGDFNGDGKADVVLYNSHNSLAYIGMGNGDGTFTFQSLFWSPGYNFVESGDLNGDGMTDFALYNSSTGTMYTGISNGTGGFTYRYTLITSGYTFVRLADFTGDGKADIFLYNVATGQANLGVGDGTGGFTFHALSMSPGYNLADLGDLDGDGKMDLIVYNSTNGNTATGISDGMGGLTFAPLLFSPGFTSVRLADYTGDGKADITVYNKNTAAAYFGIGNGAGNFTFQSLFWSPAYDVVEPQDVNGDGKMDIILYNSTTTGTEYTGISNGNGTFTYTYSLWGPGKVLAR